MLNFKCNIDRNKKLYRREKDISTSYQSCFLMLQKIYIQISSGETLVKFFVEHIKDKMFLFAQQTSKIFQAFF